MEGLKLHHYGNSLHIYCRLVDMGFSSKVAKRLAKGYEFMFHKVLYGGAIQWRRLTKWLKTRQGGSQ